MGNQPGQDTSVPDAPGKTPGKSTITLGNPKGKEPKPKGHKSKSSKTRGDQKFVDYYDLGEQLGEGSFGIVYACSRKGEAATFLLAVKMVDKVETPVKEIEREANLMKKMEHPFVMKCHDTIFEKCFVCIVMDRLRGGDLINCMQNHWKSKGRIDYKVTASVTFMMASGIDYLHSKNIIHRDVKADNYLCDSKDITSPTIRIVLTDFGSALELHPTDRLKQKTGTKLYWSPEFYAHDYALKVDVWAVGIILFGLIHARFPFKNEAEVRTKGLKFDKDAPEELKTLNISMLEKEEEKRISASQVVKNACLQKAAEDREAQLAASGDSPISNFEISKPGAANAQEPPDVPVVLHADDIGEKTANKAIHERREELVGRMFGGPDAPQGGGDAEAEVFSIGGEANANHWLANFKIRDHKKRACEYEYQWWPQRAVDMNMETNQDQGESAATLERAMPVEEHSQKAAVAAKASIARMMKDHGIDTDLFGIGQAKTLDELATEVVSGSVSLMLDAAEHKKLVRVVDVVALRIYNSQTLSTFLVETGEKFSDGRTRVTNRLPGTKKDPHENSRQTVERIMDMVHLGDVAVAFDLGSIEEYEVEEMSKTYPGVRTVYRKKIIQGVVDDSPSSSSTWQHEACGITKYFQWMAEEECVEKGIEYQKPTDENEISALVAAPVGYGDEEDLEKYLAEHKVDISKFGKDGTKSLSKLAAELHSGDATLVLGEDGSVIRVVDVILLRLINPRTGDVLVQVQECFPDGRTTTLDRLPGTKGRANENQFQSARRILAKDLHIPENCVNFRQEDVKVMQKEQNSISYPGLRAVYMKRIITAYLDDFHAGEELDESAAETGAALRQRTAAEISAMLCIRCW